MRFMALDIGEKRIGIALSESGVLATPHSILQRKSKREDFARIVRLLADLRIDRLVVGLPYSLSEPDQIGPQARRVKRYAEALAREVGVPVDYFDESYSTVDAANYLAERGNKRRTSPIDDVAAAVILQNYLDARRTSTKKPET